MSRHPDGDLDCHGRALANPIGDFPLNDDWVYGLAVKSILDHGEFRLPSPASTNLFAQAYWGALFCLPFGFSFTALRISTLVLELAGIWATYGILRDLGAGSRIARERIGERASRRMDLALLAAVLAAGDMAAVAFIRASNRHYHLMHLELNLENSSTVLIVWTTLVAGVSAAGFHFLGWTFLLIGSAGWTTGLFPRLLSMLYLLGGALSLFVYLFPDSEGNVLLLGLLISIWQGILLLIAEPGDMQAPEITAGQPDQA